jgi:glycine/D-amino acid oxidase-like deaminating enzyme
LTVKFTADIVVVGGGVIGTAVAYYLSKTGATICLVEKRGIASGTSGRCEGFVLVNDKMPGFDSRLALMSQSMFSGFSDEIGHDIEWRPAGSILVVESEEELEVAGTFCGRLAAEGLPVSLLDRHTVCAMAPHLATDIAGGMLTASDGAVNPMALAQGLTGAARENGVRILTGTTVRRIRRRPDGTIDRVETDAGSIVVPIVVNAAGVHVPAIGKMVGLDIPVRPRQGQILVTERTFPITRRKMMEFGYLMAKFEHSGYRRQVTPEMAEYGVAFVFEPTGAGNYLIGSSRRFAGFDLTTDPAVVRAIAQRAVRFYPVLKQVRLIRSYAGLRPYTPDHFPIVSSTDVPGFYIAGGHEGNGITLSLATGRLMAEMITGIPTAIETRPLHLDRFNQRRHHG